MCALAVLYLSVWKFFKTCLQLSVFDQIERQSLPRKLTVEQSVVCCDVCVKHTVFHCILLHCVVCCVVFCVVSCYVVLRLCLCCVVLCVQCKILRPRRECDLTLAKETGNGGEWHLLDTPHSTHASCSSFLSFCNFCLSHFFNSLSAGGEWHLPDTAHSIHACSASISPKSDSPTHSQGDDDFLKSVGGLWLRSPMLLNFTKKEQQVVLIVLHSG